VNAPAVLSVFITGGASGIGAATARRVLAAGGSVDIVDTNREAMRALADELGDQPVWNECDVLDEEGLTQALNVCERRMAPVTGLVNCAGIPSLPKKIEETSADDFSRLVDSHLKGTFIACKVVGAPMAAPCGGAIVNLAPQCFRFDRAQCSPMARPRLPSSA
jgi:NAD(P)-dependent dehydrogenase (short-subunit alcohol dehydrogenase family)